MKKAHLGVLLFAGLGAVALAAACSSSEDGTSSSSTSTGSGPGCAPTDPKCPALAVESDCLGLVDNSGKDQFVLRLSQLAVTAPKALTGPTVAKVVGDGVNINLPECNIAGKGTFSLVVEFDLAKGMLRAGGAAPVANPAEGYCYVYDEKNKVAPVDVKATFDSSLKFSTEELPKITLPVYVDATATSAVFLPVTGAKLVDGQISEDHNCIGSFNASGLEPVNSCLPDPAAGIDYFINGAKLTGYITIEEADSVMVDLLGQSLCVLLSGDPEKYGDTGSPKKCKRTSGKVDLEGDWCSTTNSAGGCKDSFKLEAALAASSVKFRDDCAAPPSPTTTSSSSGAGGAGAGGAGGSN
ncbi:MAG: hypothetical protein FJ096_03370 [Deltaproteobacteria bacterium]|nr:hypothetical protein [Deltaproteobacteria bacterium]